MATITDGKPHGLEERSRGRGVLMSDIHRPCSRWVSMKALQQHFASYSGICCIAASGLCKPYLYALTGQAFFASETM